MSKEFEAACAALQKREISFDKFARLSRVYWYAQARSILRRWESPSDVDAEDLVQVMLLEAWLRSDTHDAGRASFRGYLTWNAIDQAKKFLHKQRGALGGKGTARSRHPRNLTGLQRTDDDDKGPVIEPTHDPRTALDQAIELKAVVDNAITTASTEHGACALAAFKLSGYDLGSAGDTLFEDKYCRHAFAIQDRRSAARLVGEAIALAL